MRQDIGNIRTIASGDFISTIKNFTYLEPGEEKELIKLACTGDLNTSDTNARNRLVEAHIRLAISTARKFKNYGLPMADLISAGNVGLMEAVLRFKPEANNRFSTYAVYWIRAMILEYVMANYSLIKGGNHSKYKRFFTHHKRVTARLESEGYVGHELTIELSKRLGLSVEDTELYHQSVRAIGSLDAPVSNEIDGGGSRIEFLVDDRENQEDILVQEDFQDSRLNQIKAAVSQLNEREVDIFYSRLYRDEPLTLEDLAQKYKISRERVRQLEVRAVEKVQKFVNQSQLELEAA